MVPAPFRVFLDANVLFPLTLRDTLLRAAPVGLYQVHWSGKDLAEAVHYLVATGRMNEEQAHRVTEVMQSDFPESADLGIGKGRTWAMAANNGESGADHSFHRNGRVMHGKVLGCSPAVDDRYAAIVAAGRHHLVARPAVVSRAAQGTPGDFEQERIVVSPSRPDENPAHHWEGHEGEWVICYPFDD